MKKCSMSLDIGEVMNKLDPVIYPHKLKWKGWTIAEFMESLEVSFIAGGRTTLEHQQDLPQLNIYPMPLESYSLLCTNTWVLMSSGRHVLTVTFKAALFEIANNWQLTKCLSMGEWTDKLVYYYDSIIPMMEYCLQGIYYNENNVLLHATTWLTLTQCWRKACRHKTVCTI